MTRPRCPCGKPAARIANAAEGGARWLPGCKRCWQAYLDGHTRDDGRSAQANHTPPLERNGLLVPAETSLEWQKDIVRTAERLGRKNPFRG